jgi:hypothetical protein
MAVLDRAVAALRIVGDDLSPDEVSTPLGTPPTRSFARGDEIRHRRAPTRVAKLGLSGPSKRRRPNPPTLMRR